MGMGLLGAMGGLGQAGMDVGKQMMQAALREDEINYLQQKQLMVDKAKLDMQKAYANEERTRIGEVVKGATGPVSVDGPPTEDGVMPTREMSHKEKTKAAGQALISSGYMKEGEGLLNIASREDTAQDKYYNALLRQQERLESREKVADMQDKTKRHGIDTRAGVSAALQRWRESRGGSGGSGSTSSSSRSGGSGGVDVSKAVAGAVKEYGGMFDADTNTNRPADLYGRNAFEYLMENGLMANPGARPGDVALQVLDRIEAIRKQATDEKGTLDVPKYRSLLNAMRKYQTKGEVVGEDEPSDNGEAPPFQIERLRGIYKGEPKAEGVDQQPAADKPRGMLHLQNGQNIYSGVGPSNQRDVPLKGVPVALAQMLDVLRGKYNHEATGKPFRSYADELQEYMNDGK